MIIPRIALAAGFAREKFIAATLAVPDVLYLGAKEKAEYMAFCEQIGFPDKQPAEVWPRGFIGMCIVTVEATNYLAVGFRDPRLA